MTARPFHGSGDLIVHPCGSCDEPTLTGALREWLCPKCWNEAFGDGELEAEGS